MKPKRNMRSGQEQLGFCRATNKTRETGGARETEWWTVYIRYVHLLIENCLLLRFDLLSCVYLLQTYAFVPPPVTVSVWRVLVRENREFFTAYLAEIHGNAGD
eukprot:TRINITY_DN22607_c0_g1_i1.p1 TRINITY_DN22607_c0_g1~~TRINITY_DN22607_c0_g1_i1.p1  ORF type:complete len:103 (-),score=18.98 TRINITY_DN22607_c0_g1_i1:179-487(-)